MSDQAQVEARLSTAELEVVNASRSPAIEQASDEQLKILDQRLRRARDKAKDVAARQKREMRGKSSAKRDHAHSRQHGYARKGPSAWGGRVEEELSRREKLANTTTTQADLSRHALELKLSHPTPPHPGSGPTASKGKKSKERQKPLRVGTSKGEVGRVSQAGKVAQARKDSTDR